METVAENLAEVTPQRTAPEPIFNCPQCSRWLPEGTLACPDCETIVYSAHLREIALAATTQEKESQWVQAQATWREALGWLPEETKQREGVEQRIALIDTRLRSAEENKAKWTRRLGPFAPVLFFLAKLKSLLFLPAEDEVPAELCGLLRRVLAAVRVEVWAGTYGFDPAA